MSVVSLLFSTIKNMISTTSKSCSLIQLATVRHLPALQVVGNRQQARQQHPSALTWSGGSIYIKLMKTACYLNSVMKRREVAETPHDEPGVHHSHCITNINLVMQLNALSDDTQRLNAVHQLSFGSVLFFLDDFDVRQ